MSVKRKIDIDSLPHYTVDDWKEWEGEWELIDGIPHAMAPMPSKQHQRVNTKLVSHFSTILDTCDRCETFLPLNYKVNDLTVLHPDMIVVCDEPANGLFLENKPSLVAEVLSPSTEKIDRNRKQRLYAGAGIKYYLIIDPEGQTVEVWEIFRGKYRLVATFHDGTFDFDLGKCKVTADFSKIW